MNTEGKKDESFETWGYRRIYKIQWTASVTNTEVYNRISWERKLTNKIKIRKTSYLRHILRNDKYHGQIKRKRGLSRKKIGWETSGIGLTSVLKKSIIVKNLSNLSSSSIRETCREEKRIICLPYKGIILIIINPLPST